jgi:predicted aspartyl protease
MDGPGGEGSNRRQVLGALAVLSTAPAWPALAQAQTPAPPEIAEPRLLTNLLTRMAARVAVNGRNRYAFVIDTGAGRTAVSDQLAREMNLPPGPPVLVHGVTSAEIAPTVRLNALEFGGRRFNNILAPVFPRALLAADGLIGLDVLSRFRLTFDLGRRIATLAPSGGSVMEASVAFQEATRMERQGRSAMVEALGQLVLVAASAEGRPVRVFIDSGAQYSIGNPALRDAVSGPSGGAVDRRRVEVFGVIGQSIMAEVGGVRDLRIGRHSLGDTPLLFADLHAFRTLGLSDAPTILMGADLLTRFRRVSVDFGRARMNFSGLRPASRPPDYGLA